MLRVAITKYEEALLIEPRSSLAHYGIGVALRKLDDSKGAIVHLQVLYGSRYQCWYPPNPHPLLCETSN